MTNDEKTAGRWDKEEMRFDDGPADPHPPRSGDERAERAGEDEVIVADVVAVDPGAGEVTAARVVAERVPAEDAADPSRDAADWNKGQMQFDNVGEGADVQPRYDPDAMLDSEAGPTGGRANPGGGQRFGDVDHVEDAEGRERR